MEDTFDRFIQDQLHEIMRSMDEECRSDPIRCRQKALDWISENAESYRKKWYSQNHNTFQNDGSGTCNGIS